MHNFKLTKLEWKTLLETLVDIRLLDSAGYCCEGIQSIQYVQKMLYPKVNIHACVQTRPWQESSKPCAKNYFSVMVGRG